MPRRSATLMLVVAFFASACSVATSGPTPAPTSGSTPVAPATGTPQEPTSTVSLTAAPFDFGDLDQALAAEYEAEGLSKSEAVFLALTRGEAVALGNNRYLITEHYPTGNTGEITVTITPDQVQDPYADDALSIQHTETAEEWRFTLDYFVPYDGLPAEVVEQIRSGSTAALGPVLAFAGAPLAVTTAEAKDGAAVVAEAIIKKYTVDSAKEFIKYLDKVLGTGARVDEFYKRISAALAFKDSIVMTREFNAFDDKLGELEQCVENPTNRITKDAYRNDPTLRQRLLDQIESTRGEIKANVAVSFMGLLVKTGSSLIRNVPWLSWVVGPTSAWSRDALRSVSQKLLVDLEKNITPCDEAFALEISAFGLPNRTAGYAEIDVEGRLQGCPREGGGWDFSGAYSFTSHRDGDVTSSDGWLLDMIGRQTPDRFELLFGFMPTPAEQAALPPSASDGSGELTVTDALGTPRASARIENAFDELIGTFAVAAVPVEPHCAT